MDEKDKNQQVAKTATEDKSNSGGTFGSGPVSGYDTSSGTLLYSASDDILKGQAYMMYDNVKHLVGTQEQYQPRAGSRKIVNFRQDYVVLIRKKLFYAANAANQQIGKDTEQEKKENAKQEGEKKLKNNSDDSVTSKGNYMRTYKIDVFTNISISHSILSAGTCSITMKGNERVMCYEHGGENDNTNPSIDDLIGDFEHGGIHSSYTMDYESSSIKKQINQVQAQQSVNAKNDRQNNIVHNYDKDGNQIGNRTITTIGGATQVEQTQDLDYYQEHETHIKTTAEGRSDSLDLDLAEDYTILPDQPTPVETQTPKSDWKIVEKCDFEAMDEVWVFGKSNFERNKNGEFKMNQIFFGYINDVKKTHSSGSSNGCVVSITAKDQLKLLELSYVSTQPSMIAGTTMNGAPGIDIRWGRQDARAFGTMEIYNPYEVMAVMAEQGADKANDEQQKVLQSLWKSFALKDVFSGMRLEQIIRQVCSDAGVPPWYLTKRIEPIQFPPFTYNIKQSSSDQVFSAATETRLKVCRRATQDLMLEFFADEEGNIVMKCPNYALGANTKVANNMGYEQLKGGLLNSPYLGLYNMTNEYWAIQSEDITKKALEKENKEDNAETRQVFTKEYKEYKYAEAAQKAVEYCNGDVNQAQYLLSGSTITNPVANRLMRGDVSVKIEDGMTLYDLAQSYMGDGNKYGEIYTRNKSLFLAANASENELSKLKGQIISIPTKGAQDADKNDYAKQLENETKMRYDAWQAAGGKKYEDQKVSNGTISKQKFESTKHMWYEHTLSELTDELIPEIPQEYIIGFTLTDSDENLFNMYEVNITGDFSPFDSGGPQTQIRRVFPDLDSMIRFGCRPNPKVFNFPHMGNKDNAQMLCYMLCAKSVAERYSATLNMIEDSSIKIGNPIRFFAYDEHPHKPLGSQEHGSSVPSALSTMSNSQQQVSLQDASNAITSQVQNTFQNEIAESLQTISTLSSGGEVTQSSQKENSKSGINEINPEVYNDGDDFNVILGKLAGSEYKGVGASWLALQTDAQSIYYVSAIRRDIQMGSKESTMTLTLTHGRMLGKPSCIDQMMLLYKTYYDTNTGFCPDLSIIMAIRDKYKGNTQPYCVKAGDTLASILQDIYGVDISLPQLKPLEEQKEEDLLADQQSTYSLTSKGTKTDSIHYKPYQNGWKRLVYESEGEYWKFANGGTGSGEKIDDYKVYVYDGDQTKFVYVGYKKDAKTKYTEQEPYVSSGSGQESYSNFVKEVGDALLKEFNKNARQESKKPQETTKPQSEQEQITALQKQNERGQNNINQANETIREIEAIPSEQLQQKLKLRQAQQAITTWKKVMKENNEKIKGLGG